MSRDTGPAPLLVGAPLAALYGLAVRFRNKRYDAGRHVWTPTIPVISVGNLTVGGVGKTPVVQRFARLLQSHGHRPAVLLRGYKPIAPGVSDEQAEHADALPGVVVVANPDRIAAVQSLLSLPQQERPTCVILDDGFQHRQLGRTLDVVLIDARKSPWRDRLLPAGWLRESPASLRRADTVVLTHADLASDNEIAQLSERIESVQGMAPIALTRHAWTGFQIHTPNQITANQAPVSWLARRRVVVLSAIGKPGQLLTMVQNAGGEIVDRLIGRDHAKFRPAAVATILKALDPDRGDAVLCTAKDWPRLSPALPAGFCAPVAYPVLSIEAIRGGDALDQLVLDAAGPPELPE